MSGLLVTQLKLDLTDEVTTLSTKSNVDNSVQSNVWKRRHFST